MSRVAVCNVTATARPQVASTRRTTAARCEVAAPLNRVKQVGVALIGTAMLVTAAPAFADDAELLEIGADVFNGNCAACHAGGGNSVQEGKTLERAALEQYLDGGFNEKAIITQVTYGKNAMPAWGDRLSEEEIGGVAKYVYTQASGNLW